jgi:hypothetical protein
MKVLISICCLLLAGFVVPGWADPVVTETCGRIVVVWTEPPSFAPEYAGIVWVDGQPHEFTFVGNSTLQTLPIPLNAVQIDNGFVVGTKPEWLGYIEQQPIQCEKAYLPIVWR